MPRRNLADLARVLEAKAKAIDAAASKTAVNVAIAMVKHLAYNTPVDTSQALSNWVVSLDNPYRGTVGAHVPGMFGSTHAPSAEATIAQAIYVLANKKPGQPIYITNNLDYIVALNQGTISKQPGSFVEAALLIGRNEAKKFKVRG